MDESKSSNRLPFGHYWKWSLIKFDLGACSSAIFRNSRTNIYHEWWVGPRATEWKKLDFKSAWVYFCKVVGNNSLLINHFRNADVLKWQWKKKKPKSFLRLNRNVVVSRLKSKNEEAAMQKMWNVLLKLFGFHLWLEIETRANMLKLETISSWADPELEIYGSLSI